MAKSIKPTRNYLSDSDAKSSGDKGDEVEMVSPLIPTIDTGVKPISLPGPPPNPTPLGPTTKATKRGLSDTNNAPKLKRMKGTHNLHAEEVVGLLKSIQDSLCQILEGERELARKFDDMSTMVSLKMAMETKITTANERITSLQTARRDGLLGQLNPPIVTPPLVGVPHYVPATASPVATMTTPLPSTDTSDITNIRRQLGLE